MAAKRAEYTEAVGDAILDLLAQGIPLIKIAGRRDMPSADTIYSWRRKQQAFGQAFDDAQEAGTRVRMERYEGLAVKAIEEKIDLKDEAMSERQARLKLQERDMRARNYAKLAQLAGNTIAQKRKIEAGFIFNREQSDEELLARLGRLGVQVAPLPSLQPPKAPTVLEVVP